MHALDAASQTHELTAGLDTRTHTAALEVHNFQNFAQTGEGVYVGDVLYTKLP